MKNSLKLVSLIFAVGVPATVAAELAGLVVPAPIDTLHVFAAYVAAVALLTLANDYARPAKSLVRSTARPAALHLSPLAPVAKAEHALAA